MRILIAYAGKTGTCEKCVGILGQKLKDATVINLLQQDEDVNKYDIIIIGSSIRMGMIHNKVRNFMNKNKDILKNKEVAYFICCGFSENSKQYFESNIPKELLDSAVVYDTFGGEMDLNKQKGLDKLIVKMVTKDTSDKKEIKILYDNIENFIEKIKEI